jgi:predicted small metal-binding protein
MDSALRCDCGFVANADDEDGLITEIRRHALQAHGMELSEDEAALLESRARREAGRSTEQKGRDDET